jgi:hypothetical protein
MKDASVLYSFQRFIFLLNSAWKTVRSSPHFGPGFLPPDDSRSNPAEVDFVSPSGRPGTSTFAIYNALISKAAHRQTQALRRRPVKAALLLSALSALAIFFTPCRAGASTLPLTLTPASYNFGVVAINTASNAATFTLKNNQSAALSISSLGFTGANAGDFAQRNTCGISLAPGTSCTLSVTFTPSTTAAESATLTVNDTASAPYNTLTSSLSGTGVADAGLTPASASFGSVAVNTASNVKSFTLYNTELVALNISGISFTGANAADFAQTNTCGTSLAARTSCTLSVTFTPRALGAESATLTVNDSASPPYNTLTSSLSGMGVADATLTPASASLGSVAVNTASNVKSVTLYNNESVALNISGISITGANAADFAQTNTCGTSLAARTSCTLSVTFTPSTTAVESATLTVNDSASAPYNTLTSLLSGTGIADATLTPASASFGSVAVNTASSVKSFTLHNNELVALNISSIRFAGANAGDFAQTNTCGTLPATLPAVTSCSISVTLIPSAVGAERATLMVNDGASAPYNTLTSSLSGTGTGPVDGLSPTNLSFGSQPVGTTSAAQTVTLTNSGNAPLSITSLAITGNNASDFAQTNNCGSSVGAGANCKVRVTFTPSASGSRTASIIFADNASGSPQTVSLSGTGTAPAASLSATSVSFGNQSVGTTSAVQAVTLTNAGNAPLSVTSFAVTGANAGDFEQTNSCGNSMGAGANCTIVVMFTPSASGSRTASLTVTDNAAGSPQMVSLSGIGIVAGIGLSPAGLAFGNQPVGTTSAVQTVTLTSTGNATLTISSIALTGTNESDFAQTNTCPSSVAAGANCTISVNFTPSASGARTAALSIADNASGSPHQVSLSGTGTAAVATLSPASLAFGNQSLDTTSAPQVLTLTNTGNATLVVTSLTMTGANAGDFAGTNTCSSPVAAGGNCTISVTFTPTAAGTRTAVLSITDNAVSSPQTATLSGTDPAGVLPAGCGAGFDQSTCGNVGDPYAGQGAPTPNATISSCGALSPPFAGYVYRLTANIGTDPTAKCITWYYTYPFVLDLYGYTVTGSIKGANNPYGLTIMNGTVNCNSSACVEVQQGSSPAAYDKIHHLTVNQAAVGGFCIDFEQENAYSPVSTRYIQIYNVQGTFPNILEADTRSTFVWVDGVGTAAAEVWNCTFSPGANLTAFEGIVMDDTPGSCVHNNYIVLPHPSFDLGQYDTDRAILLDCEGKVGNGCGSNIAAYNQVVADEHRALRVRAETGDILHDNLIQNCRLNEIDEACIHIGDTDTYTEATSAEIYNNTIEMNDGGGIELGGSSYESANVHDNTVTCYLGNCSNASWFAFTSTTESSYPSPIAAGQLTVKNTTFPSGWGSRNAVLSCGPAGNPAYVCHDPSAVDTATVIYLNTGTVVGNGTITQSSH